MPILGLATAESYSTDRFKNYRRSVFYFYPNGAAPLTGVLSLLSEEVTNDPEFHWFEKRMSDQRTTTAALNSDGPFGATGTNNNKTTAGWSDSAGTAIRVKTVSNGTNILRVGHQVKIANVSTTTTPIEIVGVVTEIVSTTAFEMKLLVGVTNALNTTVNNGLEVWVVGNAFAEGAVDTSRSISNTPTDISNLTQIFRTPFSMTGTALKTAVKFDDTGAYKDMAKEASVFHMTELEKAFIFGERTLGTNAASGLPERTTAGILAFLKLFEAGQGGTYNGLTNNYGNAAATSDSDDNKRIITNASGTLSEKQYDGLLERLFRVTNNQSNEKLVLCGSGFLSVINQLYKSRTCLCADLPMTDTYGMDVVKHRTNFGTIYYKTHPLFSQNPTLRYNALFLDVNNLKYRYLNGRDTELLKNRQPNDADYRKDEYLTECGLEVRFPESHMYLQNVRDYSG
jgi:hypothetical protein